MQGSVVLSFDELSRCDDKGLNFTACEGQHVASGAMVSKDELDASADALKRSVVIVGTEHEEMETAAAESRVDEGHDLMLQVLDSVNAIKEFSSTRVMSYTR